jgi:hypothetical protein
MNKYIIPICDIQESKVYNLIISARSLSDCQDRVMAKFNDYSDEWKEFVKNMDNIDILIGEIKDIEEL